ncbi:hypothetical protein Kpol_1013p27 [Vanderwaltozyma polyspora DSM 70294]|uniref:Glucose-signaling factor 2 n=1 Tax=Vanderwaltozyma polyspora (strain ATCC 22028 / DSM 70294 / BCRC 21397 / CBS 2163 / NBRC 10782 / NRRL Y-8283 / UCD 57-17) TaxID=436907 RepID=A7TH75_VANPO|nr:uncharacterized protein Kpol_1013p27 [Vanderwaltozyma polyspora DSM 70294]EDO18356.1 hypothetical protein Kpol_1013p27 [Vanderwaltozyma polyspora DSM 70294]
MEVYVRFNDDVEHDYAFQLDENDTIDNKIKNIFSEDSNVGLSSVMVLRPTVFHERIPIGYSKSVHPGYLTEGGCLIFHYEAGSEKYRVKLDEKTPLMKQLWSGQLILPKWKLSKKNIFIYVTLMLLWLYTDLPDCISPTPGICLTNCLSRALIPVAERFELYHVADKLREEIAVNYSGVLAQWGFFFLHILKILFITLTLTIGMVNPLSFNPWIFIKMRVLTDTPVTPHLKKVLHSIGWLGARRANYDDYQQNFYAYQIGKYGGVVQARRADKNIISIAARPGFSLGKGEGFQSPLEERFTASTFKTLEEKKMFILSEEYFAALEENLKENVDLCQGDIGKMNNEIRRFRRYGLYECNDKIKKLVSDRKSIQKELYPDVTYLEEQERLEPKKEK